MTTLVKMLIPAGGAMIPAKPAAILAGAGRNLPGRQAIPRAGAEIPLLERFLKSRRPDLKLTAQYAIQYIRERETAALG